MALSACMPTLDEMSVKQPDLLDISKWWLLWSRGRAVPSAETIFSENGLIVRPHAALFLYKDPSSKLVWISWFVTNPESSKQDRDVAQELLIDASVERSKAMGGECLITFVNHDKLKDRYLKHGFTMAARPSELVRRL